MADDTLNPTEFDKVATQVDEWLTINSDNLDAESLRNSRIFTNLHRLYNLEASKLRNFSAMLEKLELLRWKHYNGLLDGKHYREDPLPVKPIKSEVPMYLKSDATLQEMREIVAQQDRIVSFIEDSIKQAKNRNFEIKNAIDFRKMLIS